MYKYLANTLFTGKNLVYLPTCHSTNEFARQVIQKGQASEGTIIVTDNQTQGKGQRGNTWEAAPGENITFSIIYRPQFLSSEETFWLTIITSLALKKAISEFGVSAQIKWPNDIYVGSKKLAGILIENTLENRKINYSVIGIGLNLNQRQFKYSEAISMYNITGRNYDPVFILENIAVNVEKEYVALRNGRYQNLKQQYLSGLLGLEEQRIFEKPDGELIEGRIIGVDESGRLKMEAAGNITYFSFKEIKFIFPANSR